QMLFRKFQLNPDKENLEELVESADRGILFRPNNSKVALETGKIFLALLGEDLVLDPEAKSRIRKEANRMMAEATDRRPNDAMHAAYRAFCHAETGQWEQSRQWAGIALELDARNPHADKDLANFPFRVDGRVGELNIEQELNRIRSKKLIKTE
ncbi:MAG: hypothetical protein VX768_14525, partial [Planctomycetota bacterium]|nr:hypothetical protein [Planctomycetota bacterium]